ncbi:Death-associated protein kinase related [Chionoecetes opilio]|uniref:Death-associated protein kinase related n=1 Tax=Chionoecetes opilio TaxID=41210 RepID=A0A8J4YI69_CHIOP|nr:Death-associated protein kinase related [Chionoecetes opilio]
MAPHLHHRVVVAYVVSCFGVYYLSSCMPRPTTARRVKGAPGRGECRLWTPREENKREKVSLGKFAAVRRARHRATGQVYAAKYVRRRRLEGEARHEVAVLLLGLRDPHIVRLHQVYQTRIEYIILLEFAVGGDLQRLLEDAGSLPEGDVRPQNLVMMGDSPEAGVKLVDFGLSRVISQGTEITQIMGTPDYSHSSQYLTWRINSRAVGVLTYVFLTGFTPFGGDTDQETFVSITQAEVDFPDDLFSDISEEAKDFICCLLVKKPSDRMTVDDCLNHTWMTTALPLCPAIISEALEDVEEETTDYHSVYAPHTYSPSYPPPTEHLYPLPENDPGDSAYSSDSSSSPTFTEGYSGLVVPPLCHSTIPEEQHYQQKQTQKQASTSVIVPSARRRRSKGHHLSVDMEDTLRSLHPQQPNRALRRASLALDDSRYLQDTSQQIQDILRPLSESQRPLAEEGTITRDSDVDSGVSCHDCEESRVENQRLCHSDSYDGGDAASVMSWDDYADLSAGRRPSLTQYDPATLCSKPWEKLCNGSVSRAMTQLTVRKSVVPTSPEVQTCTPDFRGSKADLRDSINNLHASKSDLRMSKAEMRASKLDLRAFLKAELRSSKSDLRASKSDLRASKQDLRASRQDLRASKPDLRASRSDLRASKSDLRASNDLRASKSDFRASNLDLRMLQRSSNLTLSRLDLAHETLDDKCLREDEGDDVLRCDLTLPRRKNINRTELAPFMRGNSLHMSFRVPKRRDMQI